MSEVYYKDILREEYNKKRNIDPEYSLKKFSVDCGLSANRMSDILNDRYGISKTIGESICDKLSISGEVKKLFSLSVESEHARSKTAREVARKAFRSIIDGPDRVVTEEELKVIYDWKTVSLIELMRHPNFDNRIPWLVKRMDLSQEVIEEALERMMRVGCVTRVDGGYKVNAKFFAISSKVPSEIIQKYHNEVIDLGKKSITEKAVDERDLSSITFLCDPSKMDEIRNKIKKFRFDLANEYSSIESESELHMLNIQFFNSESRKGSS